jgi:hypothetical protein
VQAPSAFLGLFCVSIIPVLLVIDSEPDQREALPGSNQPWLGFERLYEFLTARRDLIMAQTARAAHFNWFWRMDPQIEMIHGSAEWPVHFYRSQITELAQAGDALGLHAHAFRWDQAAARWINDYGNPAWIESCLRRSFAAYRSVFGRDCTLFRFGDGWFDEAIIPTLEALGARIDLTIEPGVPRRQKLVDCELATGCLPDRRGAPRQPYQPAYTDFRRRDASGRTQLWALPVSTAPRMKSPRWYRPARWLQWWRSPKRRLHQFNLEISPKRFPYLFDRVLQTTAPSYAAICVRSDAGLSDDRLSVAGRNLAVIQQHPLAERFRFMTADEALLELTRARRRC